MIKKQKVEEMTVWLKEWRKRNLRNGFDREYIKFRDNYECQFCFSKEKIHIHHKDKNSSNNNEKNLICLCYACHSWVHNGTYVNR